MSIKTEEERQEEELETTLLTCVNYMHKRFIEDGLVMEYINDYFSLYHPDLIADQLTDDQEIQRALLIDRIKIDILTRLMREVLDNA